MEQYDDYAGKHVHEIGIERMKASRARREEMYKTPDEYASVLEAGEVNDDPEADLIEEPVSSMGDDMPDAPPFAPSAARDRPVSPRSDPPSPSPEISGPALCEPRVQSVDASAVVPPPDPPTPAIVPPPASFVPPHEPPVLPVLLREPPASPASQPVLLNGSTEPVAKPDKPSATSRTNRKTPKSPKSSAADDRTSGKRKRECENAEPSSSSSPAKKILTAKEDALFERLRRLQAEDNARRSEEQARRETVAERRHAEIMAELRSEREAQTTAQQATQATYNQHVANQKSFMDRLLDKL